MTACRQMSGLLRNRLIYPAIVSTLLIVGASFGLFGTATASISCLLGFCMLAIAIADARRFVIPDVLSLPSIPAGIVVSGLIAAPGDTNMVFMAHAIAAIVAAACFYAIARGFRAWRGYDGLGLGDVKLAAVAGAWTGVDGTSTVIICACLGASCYAIFLHLTSHARVSRTTMIPFGTFLAPSIWLVWSIFQIGGL